MFLDRCGGQSQDHAARTKRLTRTWKPRVGQLSWQYRNEFITRIKISEIFFGDETTWSVTISTILIRVITSSKMFRIDLLLFCSYSSICYAIVHEYCHPMKQWIVQTNTCVAMFNIYTVLHIRILLKKIYL